jgi:hypothetical protein
MPTTRLVRPGVGSCAAGILLAALVLPATAATTGPVSPTAAPAIPRLATSGTDGTVEQVRQLQQCGATMYAVGRFSSIQRKSTVYARNNAFSFDAATGAMTAWDPDVTGQVNSIAFSADCSTAYLGGAFTGVHGTQVQKIAAVSTSTGEVDPGFAHSADGKVDTLVRVGGHLLVGGSFTSVNGSTQPYFVSVGLSTGLDDHYVGLALAGHYSYTASNGAVAAANATHVYNFSLSPDETKLLVMGVFTSVAAQTRRQIFMVDLSAGGATLDPWYSREFDRHCGVVRPFYLQDASWSADLTKIFVVATGYKPANGPGSVTTDPRAGLCDSVAAFPTTSAPHLSRLWIDYTGCDSLYATAADGDSVYVGGHERYASNRDGCNTFLAQGATRVDAPGMAGFSQAGAVYTTNDPLVGEYARGRGKGADDMVITSAGLWVASDNAQNTGGCGRTSTGTLSPGHSGICFLPY